MSASKSRTETFKYYHKPLNEYLYLKADLWTDCFMLCLQCMERWVEVRPQGMLEYSICPCCGDNDTADVTEEEFDRVGYCDNRLDS